MLLLLVGTVLSLTPADFKENNSRQFSPICLTPMLFPLPKLIAPEEITQSLNKQGLKTVRDAYGDYPFEQLFTNFVVKWGDAVPVSDADVDIMGEAFETSWDELIVGRGYEAPPGCDSYYFNVYVGNTGSGTPDVPEFAAAYYTVDYQGYPMIVVSAQTLSDSTVTEHNAPHEFFHALQHATGSYSTEVGSWYWEATAEWAAAAVYPDNNLHGIFLFGYALIPHYPLNFFDYPDTGAFVEYHQYGAFIFPKFLTEFVADETLITVSWQNTKGFIDPLDTLTDLLNSQSRSLNEAFGQFAARNATWDYEYGQQYDAVVDNAINNYPSYDFTVCDIVPAKGTDGFREAPADTLPHYYGYNVIGIARPDGNRLSIDIQTDSTGSRSSPAEFYVYLIRKTGALREYVPIPLEGGTGQLVAEDVDVNSGLWLTVAATSTREIQNETFGYSYQVIPSNKPKPPSTEPPPEANDSVIEGGCRSTQTSNGFNLFVPSFVFIVLYGLRRKNRLI